ncbi:unnamed protein product [Timema podura]|uniref:Uncharacterized protein n=1 Tax=Timema podura TaxID=61482 RepID=A0ABN7NNK8_TIMPD|nr:unnamed protein product [Timema podura]
MMLYILFILLLVLNCKWIKELVKNGRKASISKHDCAKAEKPKGNKDTVFYPSEKRAKNHRPSSSDCFSRAISSEHHETTWNTFDKRAAKKRCATQLFPGVTRQWPVECHTNKAPSPGIPRPHKTWTVEDFKRLPPRGIPRVAPRTSAGRREHVAIELGPPDQYSTYYQPAPLRKCMMFITPRLISHIQRLHLFRLQFYRSRCLPVIREEAAIAPYWENTMLAHV